MPNLPIPHLLAKQMGFQHKGISTPVLGYQHPCALVAVNCLLDTRHDA